MVEQSQSTPLSTVDLKSQDQWQAWDEECHLAEDRKANKYYLPKVLIMQIANFLNNYELSKLDACSIFIRYCIEAQYKVLYNTLAKGMTGNIIQNTLNDENYRRAYVQLVTRRPFQISSSIKFNPHASEKLNMISSEYQFFNSAQKLKQQVKQVLLGGKLNAYLTLQGVLSVQAIQNSSEESKGEVEEQKSFSITQHSQEIVEVPHRVEQASIAGSDLVYIDEFGMVYTISAVTQENNENVLKSSRALDLQIKAKKVSVGFSHGFALTESNEVYTWIMQPKQDNVIDKQKSFKVEGVPINSLFTDIKSGNFQTLILTDTGFVFKIDHPVPKEGFVTNILDSPLKAVQIKRLQDIVKISANCNHFLALERKDIQPLKLWGSDKVSQWVTTIGLGDSSNVIRYQKISGEQIEKADNDFLADSLGIMQEVEQDKLRFEIGKVKFGVIGEQKIWGWGNNKWGQLGLYGCSNYPEPKTIPIPEINSSKDPKKNDYIVQVECGKRQSALITNNGQVWLTGNYVPDKIQAGPTDGQMMMKKSGRSLSNGIDINELSDEERKAVMTLPGAQQVLSKGSKNSKSGTNLNNNHYQQKKQSKKLTFKEQEQNTYEEYVDRSETYKTNKEHLKKQKNHLNKYVQELKDNREEIKSINDRENSLDHRWISVTKGFTREAFGAKGYKVESVTLGSREIVAICSSQFTQMKHAPSTVADGENKYKKGENKFRGGDQIIKKLLYLAEANPDIKYTVCYEDRFIGLVESEVSRFYYGSDIPLHRIQFFKQDSKTIWDRKKKFSLL